MRLTRDATPPPSEASVIGEPKRASRVTVAFVTRVYAGLVAVRACLGTHTARRTRVSK